MFKKKVTLMVLAMLVMAGIVSASIEKIEVVLAFGMTSSYSADSNTQTLTATNGAWVFVSNNPDHLSFSTTSSSVIATGADDASSGGVANATFSGGTWQIQLYDSNELVLNLSGTIEWYEENEDLLFTNIVNGDGHLFVDAETKIVDPDFWGAGTDWVTTDGESAIETYISGAQQGGGSLTNYLNNWSSGNVTMVIYADSSNVVPEPATIALIALGGLLLRKRSSKK
jgi:hypothetical protein